MRLLVEILLVILMVCLGWSQPFRDHIANLFPQAGIAPSRTAQLAAINAGLTTSTVQTANPAASAHAATPSAATPAAATANWMWQEAPMDKPHEAPGHVRTH